MTSNRFLKGLIRVVLITYLIILGLEMIIGNFSSSEEYLPRSKRFINLRETSPNRTFGAIDSRPEVKVDQEGFIEPSKVHARADLEIFFLGGSTTENFIVKDSLRFPYLVGRSLEKKTHLKINSYNGGTSGNDIIHSYVKLLNVVVKRQPDYVVLMHNVNDVINMLYTGSYWSRLSKYRLKVSSFDDLESIQLTNNYPFSGGSLFPNTQFLIRQQFNRHPGKDEWENIRNTTLAIDTARLYQDFESALRSFVHTCEAWNIQPILMTQQNRISMADSSAIHEQMGLQKKLENRTTIQDFQTIYSNANDIVRKVAQENQILLVDLDRVIPKKKEYIFDAVHLTAEGSQIVAKVISDSFFNRFTFLQTKQKNKHE